MRMCPICGKREIGPRAEMCKQCNANYNRKVCQDRGICPICKKEKLFGSEKECPECRATRVNRVADWRSKSRQHYNANIAVYHRKMYADRKKKGICTRCGKRASLSGKTMCGICRDKSNRSQREKKNKTGVPRHERVAYGLCYFCGDPLEDLYARSCAKCKERNIANLQKVDRANHTWRISENTLYWQWKKEKKRLREAGVI